MSERIKTDWVKVMTSGPTIDDRNVEPQEIIDMAETYSTSEYAALVWYEHLRFFGNFGQVSELRNDKDDKGRECLFAKIVPTSELLSLNEAKQKLFTSVEIKPNFLNTGKSYLVGLAITDSPASVGTTELHFNDRKLEDDNYFSAPLDIGNLEIEKNNDSLFEKFKQFISIEKNTGEKDVMDSKQFNELKELIKNTDESILQLESKYSELSENVVSILGVQEEVKPEEVEGYSSLTERVNNLNDAVEKMTNKFKELTETESNATQIEESTGGVQQFDVV